MPVKPPTKSPTKLPASPPPKAPEANPNRISFGMLSLLVGCVALSLHAIPFQLVRILSVLLSLGGITLAVLQFRTNEKAGRNFNSAIAGTLFSAAVVLLTAIGPYLPVPGKRVARAPRATAVSKPTPSVTPTAEKTPEPARPEPIRSAPQTSAEAAEKPPVPEIPSYVPKVIPFPCRKNFRLVANGAEEWTDAATSALVQGEAAVCVASAAIEQVELSSSGAQKPLPKNIQLPRDNLVIRLQVVLIGTQQKVNFESWGNSNFGDARNKPSLKDNSNHAYSLRAFGAGTRITGHERSKGLYPKLYADDELVFEAPATDAEYLRLELPASAFGEMGALHFQIAKSIIEGAKNTQPAK
jgi:hypothetical protein